MIMNHFSYFIAGGSSGLGAACARRLAAAGGQGVIADVKPPEQSLLDECGQRFVYCPADVTDEAAVPRPWRRPKSGSDRSAAWRYAPAYSIRRGSLAGKGYSTWTPSAARWK